MGDLFDMRGGDMWSALTKHFAGRCSVGLGQEAFKHPVLFDVMIRAGLECDTQNMIPGSPCGPLPDGETSLLSLKGGEMAPILGAFASRCPPLLVERASRYPQLYGVMMDAADAHNVYQMTVEQQLGIFYQIGKEFPKLGIDGRVIDGLAPIAPAWPVGKRRWFRSLRARWGNGLDGVNLTFDQNLEILRSIYCQDKRGFHVDDLLTNAVRMNPESKAIGNLGLFGGNEKHTPTFEWITVAMEPQKQTFAAFARDGQSMADEAMAFSWLFGNYLRDGDRGSHVSFDAGGYTIEFKKRWWKGSAGDPVLALMGLSGPPGIDDQYHLQLSYSHGGMRVDSGNDRIRDHYQLNLLTN